MKREISTWVGRTTLLLLVGAISLTTSAAFGAEIKFDQDNIAGTISYDGTTITGTGILFESIQGIDTPLNDGEDRALDCFSCVLNFSVDVVQIDEFTLGLDPTGDSEIVLTGDIGGNLDGGPGNPAFNGGDDLLDVTILTGFFNFSRATVVGSSIIFTGQGEDEKVDQLLDYFFGATGLELRFVNSEFVLSGADVERDGDTILSFSGELSNADLNNTIPEPGSALLLLLGLSAIAARRRRN